VRARPKKPSVMEFEDFCKELPGDAAGKLEKDTIHARKIKIL
jgi:hypothetical protein